jgi:HSP20 family molecular chaperone IbpA
MSQEKNITKTEPANPERVSRRPVVMPAVDIFESKDEVLVVADVPGADPSGLNVHFDKDQLFIEAATALEDEHSKALFREFGAVDYRRVFELSPGIDVAAIKAELKNGVLAIHLPKSAAIKPRKIQISAE